MKPKLSVIICTYNRSDSLRITLESLSRLKPPKRVWELIVVDNNSPDNTRDVVETFAGQNSFSVRYIFEGNQGLSYARNTGIQSARGDLIVFTDDDVTFDANWLLCLEAAFDSHDVNALGGKIIPVWPGPLPKWFKAKDPRATPKAIVSFDLGDDACEVKHDLVGASMAFRREIFVRYGGFRTDLGRNKDCLLGGEDVEFFERIRKGGERLLYIPEAVLYHPVPDERTKKEYFQKWCFNGARSQVRMSGLPKAVYYFDIPRFLFRSIVENFAKWMISTDPQRRFYYKLQVWINAGTLVETRRLRKHNSVQVLKELPPNPA